MPNLDTISATVVDSTSLVVSNQPVIIRDTIYKIVEHTTNKAENAIQFVADNDDTSIPTFLFLGLALIAVVLYISFKVLTEYITPFIEAKFKIRNPYLTIFRFKTLIWALYLVFSFYQLISSHFVIGISTILFIILLGINFWKDFFSGILLKLDGRLYINDNIIINNIKGKIWKLHTRNLELKSNSDEIISIPYHQFLTATVSKKLNKGEERSRTITLMVSHSSDNNSIKEIEKILTICPWIYAHKPNLVKRLKDIDLFTEYEISIYVSDRFTLKKVEEFLIDKTKIKVKHQL